MMKVSVFLFVSLILGISCSPSRIFRQAPANVTNAASTASTTTSSTVSTTTGTTTTTASPAYTRCLRTCITTSEYNPVCGTDGVTYSNTGRLNCAADCGATVEIDTPGPCPASG